MGFISVAPSRDDDADPHRVGEVPAIYALREVWGRGVGRRLMGEGIRLLRTSGFDEATLWVLSTNDRARRFYEAGGWTLDGAAKAVEIGGQLVTELRYRRRIEAEA